MPLIERRYAEALVDISEQDGAIEEYRDELGLVVDVYNHNEDFRRFLIDPQVKTEIKKDAVQSIFTQKLRKEIINFLKVLIDKRRINLLPGMLKEFNILADKRKNVLNMSIISASPLKEEQINRIKEKYKVIYNAYAVKAEIEVDPGLIGGVKVKIGDKVEDGSIKGRLQGLKEVLLK